MFGKKGSLGPRASEKFRPKVAITKNRYGHKFQNIAFKTLVVYVFHYEIFKGLTLTEWQFSTH